MRIHKITTCDVNNGEGVRVTIWSAGCSHHCPGCHNPQTWDFKGGHEMTQEEENFLFKELSHKYIKGVTFSGGDPLDQYIQTYNMAKKLKEKFPDKDIWLYTGYTYEELWKLKKNEILKYIDVLVDGLFKKELLDLSLAFRGSKNQRVLKLVNGCVATS